LNAAATFARLRGPLAPLCLAVLLAALWLAPPADAAGHCAGDAFVAAVGSPAGCCTACFADCSACESALALQPQAVLAPHAAAPAAGLAPRALIARAPPPLPPPIASFV